MEIRTVKYNLKSFIEEYIILHESKDKEGEEKLLEDFNNEFIKSSDVVKQGMQMFLFNSKIAKEYEVLQGLATMCIQFSQS